MAEEKDEDYTGLQHDCDEDAPSPSASPRDKKQRHSDSEASGHSIPGASNRQLFSGRDLLVAASPPKFINIEDVLKLSDGVTDMALAHEIAVGDNFRIEPPKSDPNSLEGRIKEVMQKAFWDVLSESLKEDPPDYSHALILLKEIKQGLMDLLLPQHSRLRVTIDEVLDLALIEQQAEHGCLDFRSYADFVIRQMSLLCAPVRDEQIAGLKNLTDIVDLYREILSVLSLMKLDMVNFTISQFRPYVQQHSVEYERKKFQALLEVQKDHGVDGLEYTRSWLNRHTEKIATNTASKSDDIPMVSLPAGASGGCGVDPHGAADSCSSSMVNAVLNDAYLETLEWDDVHQVFPETLLMDQLRFLELRDKVSWLTLTTSVLIVTYNTVGGAIAGLNELKTKLTNHITVITKGSLVSNLSETMASVAEQVIKEVNQSLAERSFPEMKEGQQQLLKGQIGSIIEPNNTIYRLMKSRLMSFIERILTNPKVKDVQLPAGFSAVNNEVATIVSQFLRLVGYNSAVFGAYYSEIISSAFQSLQVRTLDSTVEQQ